MAWSQGIRPRRRLPVPLQLRLVRRRLGATAGYTLLGATVIPAGSADTERQIETIFRLARLRSAATPSFLVHLADAADRLGRPLRDSQVSHVHGGGEPAARSTGPGR